MIRTAGGDFTARNPRGLPVGARALLFVRPEAMRLGQGDNGLAARLVRRDLEGAFVTLHFDTGAGPMSLHRTNGGADLPAGNLQIRFDAQDPFILADGGEAAGTGQAMAAE